MVNWSRFDKVYVQCYTGYANDRQPSLEAELSRVGIREFERHWSCPNPIERDTASRLKYYKPKTPGGFQCLFGHYQLIKTAYELGYGHILVLEDDVRFVSDLDVLSAAVSGIPDDYDVAKFEWSPFGFSQDSVSGQTGMWVPAFGLPTHGHAAVAYSRTGMRTFLNIVDNAAEHGGPMRNVDDLRLHARGDIRKYLCFPLAAIQSPSFVGVFGQRTYSWCLGRGGLRSYGSGETAVRRVVNLHDGKQIDELIDLVRVAYRGRPIRLLDVGSYRGQSAKAFLTSGLVSAVYCVDPWKAGWDPADPMSSLDMAAAEDDFDREAASDSRIVKCKGTIYDFIRDHAGETVDLAYIDATKRYDDVRRIIEAVRDVVKPTLGIAGRDFKYERGIREAVIDTLGFPYQVSGDTSWFFPSDGGVVPRGSVRYWRFLGGRLGNQLYYLLQIHRMGPGNVYAGAGKDMQKAFRRLGGGDMAVDCDGQARPYFRSEGQHWKIGIHYTLADVHSFVRDVIMKSELYADMMSRYGMDSSSVAIHVRNTDFITHRAWGRLDRDRYLPAAIDELRRQTGVSGMFDEVHLFSDDNAETERRFGDLIRRTFRKVVYVETKAPEEDLVHLALHRVKILFNSTFSAWAAHIGDVAFAGRSVVVAPSVFFANGNYVEYMSTLANPAWHQVVSYLDDGRMCRPVERSHVLGTPVGQSHSEVDSTFGMPFDEWTHLSP